MRLWSISPALLDRQGLTGAWREGLLAKKCLENPGIGYSNHSQLIRFKKSKNPLDNINWHLFYIWEEANNRGYSFDYSKISDISSKERIKVTRNQIIYEYCYILFKLANRSPIFLNKALEYNHSKIPLSPLYIEVPGKIEHWEDVKPEPLKIVKDWYLLNLMTHGKGLPFRNP